MNEVAWIRTFLVVFGVMLAASACGGSQKKQTTPTTQGDQGSGDPASMGDLDPDAPGANTDPQDGRSANRSTKAPPNLDPKRNKKATKQTSETIILANQALRRRDSNAAIFQAKQVLAEEPRNIDAVVILAFANYQKRLYDTAEVILDLVLRDDARKAAANRSSRLFYVYGLIYEKTDRPSLALRAYQKAVSLDPNAKGALTNVGVHYLKNHLFDRAIQVYERLTGQLGVRTAVAWTNLASAYRGQSASAATSRARRDVLLKKAEVAYKRAISVNRNYGNVYYNLGLLYLDAKPFPSKKGELDNLRRLETAKTYFDEYRSKSGANHKLADARKKQVSRLIKREKKRRAKKKDAGSKGSKGDDFDDF